MQRFGLIMQSCHETYFLIAIYEQAPCRLYQYIMAPSTTKALKNTFDILDERTTETGPIDP